MKRWYEEISDRTDIYVASRIRLVRNLRDFSFPCRLADEEKRELNNFLQNSCRGLEETVGKGLFFSSFDGISATQKSALKERRLINKSVLQKEHPMGLMVSEDESISMVFNGDDHIRLQVSAPGLELQSVWKQANEIDDYLNQRVEYAFDDRFGYLTSFPTNVGTGMRGYVLMHLPFLELTDAIQEVAKEVSRYGLVLKGAFGELKDNPGDIVVLSNQKTLGVSEQDTIDVLMRIATHIGLREVHVRNKMMEEDALALWRRDHIYKSYGMLKYACSLSETEALNCLSNLRSGICNDLIEFEEPLECYRLMMEIQDANLQVIYDKPMDDIRLRQARCRYIQEHLPELVRG